jgi:transposase
LLWPPNATEACEDAIRFACQGFGPIGASLVVMKLPDPHALRSGPGFSAWIGLAPKDHSTAGKTRLGVITRAGDETD